MGPFNANAIKTVTLSIPQKPNWFFDAIGNFAPSFQIAPGDYLNGGFVTNVLATTGAPGAAIPSFTPPPAGANSTAPGGADANIAFAHYYTIGGRQPGF